MPNELAHLYLISPPAPDPATFADQLRVILDSIEIAALRLELPGLAEDSKLRLCDSVRSVTEERDVAVVCTDDIGLMERAGLDGVHLSSGSRGVRKAREQLGADAILGAYCGASRHDGMIAAEAGADYVAFGPVADDGSKLREVAGDDIFSFWSEAIEVPVVAEGFLTPERIRQLSLVTDFFAIGPEIWSSNDPVSRLTELAASRELED